MTTYKCKACGEEVEGLTAAMKHNLAYPDNPAVTATRGHTMVEVKPEITGFTFLSTSRDGRSRITEFGDLSTLPVCLAQITSEVEFSMVEDMLAIVLKSALGPDDKINLVHTICHSAKYAGLVKSATI